MKKFTTFLKEFDLSREPADYSNIEDRRGEKPNVKAGTKWASGLQKRNGPTVTQKQADAINTGKDNGGSPFPNSWSKPDKQTTVATNKTSLPTRPKFTISSKQRPTTNKVDKVKTADTTQTPTTNKSDKIKTADNTQTPTTNKVDRMRPNVNDKSTWPKGIDINKTSFATHADADSSGGTTDNVSKWLKAHPGFSNKNPETAKSDKGGYTTPVKPTDASSEKTLKADTRSNADLDKLFKEETNVSKVVDQLNRMR